MNHSNSSWYSTLAAAARTMTVCGLAACAAAVVEHYQKTLKLDLIESEKRDLVEYLKSL